MEFGKNFVDCFPAEISYHVMQRLNDPADVVRASAVSRTWRHFIIANGIGKKLWLRKVPYVSNVSYVEDDSEDLTILANVATTITLDWGALQKEHKIFLSLLRPLSKPILFSDDILGFPIGASSTYHDEIINIIHTLTPIDRYSCGSTAFWSSKGSADPDAPEHLLYRLRYEICIVSEIDVRPFEAILEPGRPVYAPISVRFQLGHPKMTPDARVAYPGNRLSSDSYVWTYASPVYPVLQEATLQNFKLPEPVVCVGGVFQVELIGRAQQKEQDRLFYIWITPFLLFPPLSFYNVFLNLGYLRVKGSPLDPAYMLLTLDSREFHLKYCPRAIDCIIRRITGRINRRFSVPRVTERLGFAYARPRVASDGDEGRDVNRRFIVPFEDVEGEGERMIARRMTDLIFRRE
ncbi:hypothetical protein C2S52_011068 [Perilla frutescens var. hirtella]|nr:hypothetical protein C2S52_011068 [Perilla frutescens var. hirtella]